MPRPCLLAIASLALSSVSLAAPEIEVIRVPSGGIQPQAVVGEDGAIHLLYYQGDAKAGDLYYTKRTTIKAGPDAGHDVWDNAVRVNSEKGSAVAVGNDRGGHIALGRNGAVHVAWNGSSKAAPKAHDHESPMLYARLPAGKTAFEPQRNLMTASTTLDGGGSVAADAKGNVYVVWHGLPKGAKDTNETGRRVFVAASTDDGATFAPEAARGGETSGACGCCGLKAAAMPDGALLILYRAAGESTHRDTHLLRSTDAGKTFTDLKLDEWEVNACPMTTASIAPSASGPLLAWETRNEMRWTTISKDGKPVDLARTAGASASVCRYPSIAADASGRVLLAWTEGMRWNTGGKLRWQLFDGKGQPIEGSASTADGVPEWSLVAAIPKPAGGFLVIY